MIEGQRMVLPYGLKIGDKLYTVIIDEKEPAIIESTLASAKINGTTGLSLFERRKDGYCYMIDIDQIGKTIFTSYEDAEREREGIYGEKE